MARERRDARGEYRVSAFAVVVVVVDAVVDTLVFMRADAVWRATTALGKCAKSKQICTRATRARYESLQILSLGRSTTTTTKESKKGETGRDSGNEDDVDAVHFHVRVHDDTGWIFAQNQTIAQTSVTR